MWSLETSQNKVAVNLSQRLYKEVIVTFSQWEWNLIKLRWTPCTHGDFVTAFASALTIADHREGSSDSLFIWPFDLHADYRWVYAFYICACVFFKTYAH